MISTISVIGAGVMGHAIATEFALGGYPVSVYEEYPPMRESAPARIRKMLDVMVEYGDITAEQAENAVVRISMATSLEESVGSADFVVEAVSENLELKQELFAKLHAICPPHTIIATNTSSLTLSDLTKGLPAERRSRVLICHYFNAANLMPLVEVSHFGEVALDVFDEVAALYRSVGKHVIPILKDVPGMVVNRIQLAVFREALYMLDEGITTVEDLDTALMYGTGFRYMCVGLLGGYDMTSMDQAKYVANMIFPSLCGDTQVRDDCILTKFNEEGKMGMKTGEGFYKYDPAKVDACKADFIRKLVLQRVQAKRLHGENPENKGAWQDR